MENINFHELILKNDDINTKGWECYIAWHVVRSCLIVSTRGQIFGAVLDICVDK